VIILTVNIHNYLEMCSTYLESPLLLGTSVRRVNFTRKFEIKVINFRNTTYIGAYYYLYICVYLMALITIIFLN